MNPIFYVPSNPDTAAINAQIALASSAGGGDVICPGAVYDSAPGPIIGASNVRLHGFRGATILRTIPGAYFIHGQGFNHFTVDGFTFDMGGVDSPDDPVNGSGAVVVGADTSGNGGRYCAITNNEVINADRYVFVAKTSTRRLTIKGNDITRIAPSGDPNIAIMTRRDNGATHLWADISENTVTNTCGFCGVLYRSLVSRNIFRNSAFGSSLCLDTDPNSGENIIDANICTNTIALAPGFGANGIEVWSFKTKASNNITNYNAGPGIVIAAPDCELSDHQSFNNTGPGVQVYGSAESSSFATNLYVHGVKTANNGVTPDPTLTTIFPGVAMLPSVSGTTIRAAENDFR